MKGHNYRHGDVDFKGISEKEARELVTAKAIKKAKTKLDSFVVALGEVTGHKHVMTMERPKSLNVYTIDEDTVLFELLSGASITHEEHHKITMVPGWYVKKIEREFDPFTQQFRQSQD